MLSKTHRRKPDYTIWKLSYDPYLEHLWYLCIDKMEERYINIDKMNLEDKNAYDKFCRLIYDTSSGIIVDEFLHTVKTQLANDRLKAGL